MPWCWQHKEESKKSKPRSVQLVPLVLLPAPCTSACLAAGAWLKSETSCACVLPKRLAILVCYSAAFEHPPLLQQSPLLVL